MKLHNYVGRIFDKSFLDWHGVRIRSSCDWGGALRARRACSNSKPATTILFHNCSISRPTAAIGMLVCLYLCFRTWKEREKSDKWKSKLGLDKKLVKLLSWSAQKRSKLGLGKRLFNWQDHLLRFRSCADLFKGTNKLNILFSNTLF